LLDEQGAEAICTSIRESIENDDNSVADLHLWSNGPNIYGVIVSVVARDPRSPGHFKALIPSNLGLVHVTVEVHSYIDRDCGRQAARSANSNGDH
jgi:Co/Zn/Cd efflux system component